MQRTLMRPPRGTTGNLILMHFLPVVPLGYLVTQSCLVIHPYL